MSATAPHIYDVSKVYGDGKEAVVIVPIQYPYLQFRINVGLGWSEDGDKHNAILRRHLRSIYLEIKRTFNLPRLVTDTYGAPDKSEKWEFWSYGCRWFKD